MIYENSLYNKFYFKDISISAGYLFLLKKFNWIFTD